MHIRGGSSFVHFFFFLLFFFFSFWPRPLLPFGGGGFHLVHRAQEDGRGPSSAELPNLVHSVQKHTPIPIGIRYSTTMRTSMNGAFNAYLSLGLIRTIQHSKTTHSRHHPFTSLNPHLFHLITLRPAAPTDCHSRCGHEDHHHWFL